MNQVKAALILIFLILFCHCHTNLKNREHTLPVKLEFQKMAWLEGLWTNPDDSIKIFTRWQRTNDSVLSGSSWQVKGHDSIPIQIQEVSALDEAISLSMEVFGKNDGLPEEYALIANKNGEHVFESSGKDFPKRIIFILKPDGSLYLRMEGTSDGQSRYEEKILTKIK
jgi:hypothetical protein